jgi:FAD/FMN-containing dehydrogenase
VTGYDIHQVLAGALGTLAVITRLNFRTHPMPPRERMFVAAFSGSEGALDLCRAIGKSQLQPRIVEAFNPATARVLRAPRAPLDRWLVAVAAAGHAAVIARHERELSRMASERSADDFAALDGAEQEALFGALREFPRLALEAFAGAAIFRVPILPGAMPELLRQAQAVSQRHEIETAILIRASGIVYVTLLPSGGDGDARSAARLLPACHDLMQASLEAGARPMIEWCPTYLKRGMNVWPPPDSDQPLAEKLKRLFDPQGILSPGRFLGGL